jgi:uncharacterized membrane protein YqjE
MSSEFTDPGTGRTEADTSSVGELVREVANDLSTLMRQELELAKTEVKEEIAKGGKAAGMLGGAGLAGYFVALFLSLALMWALAAVIPTGWAALVVAVLWGIVGAILYSTGRKKLRQVNPKPEQTAETLKEDVQWARTRNG